MAWKSQNNLLAKAIVNAGKQRSAYQSSLHHDGITIIDSFRTMASSAFTANATGSIGLSRFHIRRSSTAVRFV